MNTITRLGEHGADLITDTTAMTGNWFAIQFLEESTLTTLTSANITVTGALSQVVFLGGTLIFGNFAAITLATGSVLAYRTTIS
jgi:hypothetical protein